MVLDSDAAEFGGHSRLDHNTEFVTFAEGWDNRMNHMFVSCRRRICSHFVAQYILQFYLLCCQSTESIVAFIVSTVKQTQSAL